MMWSTTIVATWLALANGILTESTCEDDVVLLQHSQTLAVKHKRRGSLESNGQGTDCLCNQCSAFGADNPDDVVEMRKLFDSKCQELYSEVLCTSVAEEAFNVLDDSILFSAQENEHPLFCAEIAELIVVSEQHQSDGGGYAALLNRHRKLLNQRGKAFDQSMASKNSPSPPQSKAQRRANAPNINWDRVDDTQAKLDAGCTYNSVADQNGNYWSCPSGTREDWVS